MTIGWVLAGMIAALGAGADAPDDAAIENARLRVHVDGGLLVVQDKRNGRVWRQYATDPAASTPQLVAHDAEEQRLVFDAALPGTRKDGSAAAGPWRLTVTLAPDAPDLRVAFAPRLEGEWAEARYPYPFAAFGPDAYVVYPHCEGLLLPVDPTAPDFLAVPRDMIYSGYGPYCACLGVVDLASGAGVLTVYETHTLAGYDMVEAKGEEGDAAVVPTVYWRADKFRLDAPRSVVYTFEAEGGYVALAKGYQRHYKAWGYYRSLREKAEALPATDMLAGAPVFWVFDSPQDAIDVAEMMHEDGFERAVFNIGYPRWNHESATEADLTRLEGIVGRIREFGFVVSRYDQVRDGFKPDPEESVYHQINTEAYPDGMVRREDGGMLPAWPPGFVINPLFALDIAKRRIPADLDRWPFNGRFMDCVGTCALWEGEDWSEARPCDAHGTLEARLELLRFVNAQGLVVGTEGSMDCYLRYLHWLETPMSLVRWTAGSFAAPGWLPADVKDDYAVSIGTTYRIPFYSLVHHDEVMSTWRWEDGMLRLPEYWRQKMLWSALYGNSPMFVLNAGYYRKRREAIVDTQRYIGPWVREVAYEELMEHRFLAPDRSVQESVFSNGRGVAVNFGEADYVFPDGATIPARGYRTFTEGEPRVYDEPPAPPTGPAEADPDV